MTRFHLVRLSAVLLLLVFASVSQALRPTEGTRTTFDRHMIALIEIETEAEDKNGIDYTEFPMGRMRDGGFILGDRSAPVTVIAFQDYLCSHCQAYQTTVHQLIEHEVANGEVRFEYRFYPVIDTTYSTLTASLTQCAEILEPRSFWHARDIMFEITTSGESYDAIAEVFADEMDLDVDELTDCAIQAEQVYTDVLYGRELGVFSTPTVFIKYGSDDPVMISPAPSYDELQDWIEHRGDPGSQA